MHVECAGKPSWAHLTTLEYPTLCHDYNIQVWMYVCTYLLWALLIDTHTHTHTPNDMNVSNKCLLYPVPCGEVR